MKKALISKLVVVCMIFTLFSSLQPITNAADDTYTFAPNYNFAQGMPSGWTAENFTTSTWAFESSVYGDGNSSRLIYDGYEWYNTIDYTWKQYNAFGNTKQAFIYFFYNDANNYYALELNESGSRIVKRVGGVDTILGSDPTIWFNADNAVRIVRNEDGIISIYKGVKNTNPELLYSSTVSDTDTPTGKIGAGFATGGGRMLSLSVTGGVPQETSEPTPPPSTGEVTTENISYNVKSLDGWVGNGYKMKDASWGQIEFTNYSEEGGSVIYDDYDFTGDFSFLTTQTVVYKNQNNASAAHEIYFCYQDANNYYKIAYGDLPTTISKVENGSETVLAEGVRVNSENQVSIKVTHSADGTIKATMGTIGGNGTGTDLVLAKDTTFTHGKVGMGSKKTGGYIANITLSGTVITGTVEPTTPPSTGEVTTENVSYNVKSLDGWTGNGYTMQDPSWGQILFANYGDEGGSAVYDEYDFTGDFSFLTTQTVVYSDKNNAAPVHSIYLCYQDANNYYKFTYGEAPSTLSKVVNGAETVLAEGVKVGQENQVSIKVTHSADGTIKATMGSIGGNGTGTDLVSAKDTTFTHGKMGMGSKRSGGYIANITLSGTVITGSTAPTNPPVSTTAPPEATVAPGTKDYVEFNPNYSNQLGASLPAGWSGNGFRVGAADNPNPNWPAFQGQGYGGECKAIYDGYVWEGAIDYYWPQLNGYNGEVKLYLYYNDDNNYYSLNLTAGGTKLVKVVDGTETVLGSDTTPLVNIGGDVAVRVVRDEDGLFSVYAHGIGETELKLLYTSDKDMGSNPSGKIGMGVKMGGGHFYGLSVKGVATSMAIEATPAPTPTTTIAPDLPTPPPVQYDTIFRATDTDPETWSGSGFEVGTWNNFQFNTLGSAKLICEKYLWSGALDMSFTQISLNTVDKGVFYFMYQDDNNYYAFEIMNGSSELVKVVDGNRTVLGSTDEQLIGVQYSLRIVREANGRITVWMGTKDSTVQHDKLIDVTDAAGFNSGKIGMGYAGRTGGVQWYVNPEIKGSTGTSATPIPLEIPEPVTPEADAVSFNPTDENKVRNLGRTYEKDGAATMTWSLCGLEFNVYGAKDVYIKIGSSGMAGVIIDDSAEPIFMRFDNFKDAGYAKIASFDTASNHKIRFIKSSDVSNTLTISDIKVTGENPSLKATSERNRKIEFVGDSITVGSCMFLPGTANERMGTNALINYAGQTGLYFGAEMSMTAIGGSGFAAPDGDSMSTYKYYDYVIQPNPLTGDEYKWDFSQYRPDVVVVNIGTNGATEMTKDHYIRFYNQIRDRYNDTNNEITILFALGAINQIAWPSIQEAYAEISKTDDNVYILQLGDGYTAGTAAHPDLDQQTKMANTLINYLKEIMPGWDDADISCGAYQKSGDTLTVPYRVLAHSEEDTTNKVIVGVYDEQGELISIKTQDVSYGDSNETINQSITITGEGISEGTTAELFMWNDLSGIKPAAKNEKIDLQ
jgi:hypothetical protein